MSSLPEPSTTFSPEYRVVKYTRGPRFWWAVEQKGISYKETWNQIGDIFDEYNKAKEEYDFRIADAVAEVVWPVAGTEGTP